MVGSDDGEQTHPGLWFLPVWQGGIPDSVLLLCYVVGAGCSRRSLFPLFCVCSQVVSSFSLSFVPLSSRIYFLGLQRSAWSWQCGGATLLGRDVPGGLQLTMLERISIVYCTFFCYSRPLGHRKASQSGLVEVCLSCPCIALRSFLFWHFLQFIPLSDNRVVGSGSLG